MFNSRTPLRQNFNRDKKKNLFKDNEMFPFFKNENIKSKFLYE
jgi:hypothetical protein